MQQVPLSAENREYKLVNDNKWIQILQLRNKIIDFSEPAADEPEPIVEEPESPEVEVPEAPEPEAEQVADVSEDEKAEPDLTDEE